MLVKEIIQRVQSIYSQGVQADDSRLSSRHIYSKVLSSRARLITLKLNKKQQVSEWVYQTLVGVELIKAMPYECPGLPAVGCTTLRTKVPLPQPLTGLLNGHALRSVTSLEGSLTFSETSWEMKKYAKGQKYTSTKPDYYIRNNYLYITIKGTPKVLSITGLFDDPLLAAAHPSFCIPGTCEDNSCPECISPLDMELPIEASMVDVLVEMAAQELIALFTQRNQDISNDATDSTSEVMRPRVSPQRRQQQTRQ
jgi:hypothetical protein